MLPMVLNKAALGGVIVASATAVLAADLPYKLGLLIAVLLGMASAMIIEEWLEKQRSHLREKT
jgi:hypothetical protein